VNAKVLFVLALLSTLLSTGVVGTQLVYLVKSNPIHHYWVNVGDVAPDENTKPPAISIFSPVNDTVYGVNVVSLSLNVSIGDSSTASGCVLEEIYCETDWQSNSISVYEYRVPLVFPYTSPRISEFSESISLTGIPDGNHTLMVYAVETGEYPISIVQAPTGDNRDFAHYYNGFNITGFSLVSFTVDTTAPKVALLSPENTTYYSSEIQLDFAVNEKSSLIVYSLDGQKNETIAGNTTLTGLCNGEHSLTVYVIDEAGNTGASETLFLSVEKSFPTLLVATASIIIIVGVVVAVFLLMRKHKH
jgi:hypothetical protein